MKMLVPWQQLYKHPVQGGLLSRGKTGPSASHFGIKEERPRLSPDPLVPPPTTRLRPWPGQPAQPPTRTVQSTGRLCGGSESPRALPCRGHRSSRVCSTLRICFPGENAPLRIQNTLPSTGARTHLVETRQNLSCPRGCRHLFF